MFSISSGTGILKPSMHLRQLSKPIAGSSFFKHMPAVNDDASRTDLGCRVQILLQELAARDADAVIAGRHIQHVRRMDVKRDASICGCRLERSRSAGVR